MNKRGFLRIVEAVAAILLILGAVLLLSQREDFESEKDLTEILPPILDEIAQNSELRKEIILGSPGVVENLENFVREKIDNPILDFSVVLCKLEEGCDLVEYPEGVSGDIFVAERIISASIEESIFEPKKVRIFLWRRE